MNKQNTIKVFKPMSRKADFTILAVTPEAGIKKLESMLDDEAADIAGKAFQTLREMEADSLVFHHEGRKIKVERGSFH